MEIARAHSDEEVRACFPVMRELRTRLQDPEAFLARVRLQERTGYRLVRAHEGTRTLAVAGYRIGENLAWGRFLYVDDLVTGAESRSAGHGRALLAWLVAEARREGAGQLHLDSGSHRRDAHRFYEREGLTASGLHFRRDLEREG